MFRKILLSTAIIIAAALVLPSCKKDSNNGGSGGSGGFTYKENNGPEMQMQVVEARTQYNTIMATTTSADPGIEINLTSLNAGDYTIGGTNGVYYLKGGGMWSASGGTVKITSNANGKLSGTFVSQGSGIAGITSLSGSFTDIEIK